jgi:outer membrane cobalamin receptor
MTRSPARPRRTPPAAGLLLGLAWAGAAAAPAADDSVIVTGTRLADRADRITNAITVLTAADIDARGESSAVDLLREVPGVQVTLPGGRGGTTSVYTRGGEGNYTVFLLDGVKVNDPTDTRGGSFDFSTLSLAEVERVEFVRGPQSSVYGPDALAGIVNVITRTGAPTHRATVEAEGGGDDLRRAAAILQGPVGHGVLADSSGYSLTATWYDDGEPVPGSSFENRLVNARLRLDGDRWTSQWFARLADSEGTAFPEDSGGPEFAVLRDLSTKDFTDLSVGGSGGYRLADAVTLEALATWYERDGTYFTPAIAPGVRDGIPANGADTVFRRGNATLRLAANPRANLATTLGVDFQREDGASDGFVDFGGPVPLPFALERNILGAFAEARFRGASGYVLEGSARVDDPDGFATQPTARVGALLPVGDGRTQFRASYGSGFRLPSFFALGNPIVANPDLKPEKSRTLDLGVSRAIGGGSIGLTWFDTTYTDFIDFDNDTVTNVNRPRVDARGLEFTTSAPVGDALRLQAFASWTDLDVPGSDRVLLQRPEWRGGTSLRWDVRPGLTADLAWLYVGDSVDDSIPTGRQTLNDYQRVDLALAWQATGRLRLALAVDNLLDSAYHEAIGFPAPGIRPRLTARYRFGD